MKNFLEYVSSKIKDQAPTSDCRVTAPPPAVAGAVDRRAEDDERSDEREEWDCL